MGVHLRDVLPSANLRRKAKIKVSRKRKKKKVFLKPDSHQQ